MLQVLTATNYIPSVVLALFLLSRRSILWNINGMVSSIFLTQPFLVRRLLINYRDGFSLTTPPCSVEWLLV